MVGKHWRPEELELLEKIMIRLQKSNKYSNYRDFWEAVYKEYNEKQAQSWPGRDRGFYALRIQGMRIFNKLDSLRSSSEAVASQQMPVPQNNDSSTIPQIPNFDPHPLPNQPSGSVPVVSPPFDSENYLSTDSEFLANMGNDLPMDFRPTTNQSEALFPLPEAVGSQQRPILQNDDFFMIPQIPDYDLHALPNQQPASMPMISSPLDIDDYLPENSGLLANMGNDIPTDPQQDQSENEAEWLLNQAQNDAQQDQDDNEAEWLLNQEQNDNSLTLNQDLFQSQPEPQLDQNDDFHTSNTDLNETQAGSQLGQNNDGSPTTNMDPFQSQAGSQLDQNNDEPFTSNMNLYQSEAGFQLGQNDDEVHVEYDWGFGDP